MVALVAVGITVDRVGADLRRQLPALVLAVLAVLALAAVGTWLIARRLRRQTFDLGPAELARMYGYYDAVLHSVREGLLLLDADGRLQLANEEAERLLALPGDARGRPVDELGLPGDLVAALTRRRAGRRRAARGARPGGRGQRGGRSTGSTAAARPGGDPARPHRPAARSPASSTPPAAWPRRCARPSTRRRTGCTPWSRWSSSAGTEEAVRVRRRRARRRAVAHRQRGRRRSRSRWWRRCCSASRPWRPSAGVELVRRGGHRRRRRRARRRRPARPRPGHGAGQPGRQRPRGGGRPRRGSRAGRRRCGCW